MHAPRGERCYILHGKPAMPLAFAFVTAQESAVLRRPSHLQVKAALRRCSGLGAAVARCAAQLEAGSKAEGEEPQLAEQLVATLEHLGCLAVS